MNVFRVMGIISILMLSNLLQSMENYQSPLNEIEKQLLKREVAHHSAQWALDKIDKKSKKKPQEGYSKERDLYYTKRPTLFKIKAIFFQNQADIDPLTNLIFEKITEIEKKAGYSPEPKIAKKQDIKAGRPTNFLGNSTRYYWVNEGKKKQLPSAVKVKSHFIEREPLLEVIQNNTGA